MTKIKTKKRLELPKFAVILIFFPLQHIKKTASQNKRVAVLRMAFQARKVFGTFEKRAPVLIFHYSHVEAKLSESLPVVSKHSPSLFFESGKNRNNANFYTNWEK